MRRLIAAAIGLALLPAAPAASQTPPEATDAFERRVLDELKGFTEWLDGYNVAGYIGEAGWPDNRGGDAVFWNDLAQKWYGAVDRAGLAVTYWASGEDFKAQLAAYEDTQKPDGLDAPSTQAPVIEDHLGPMRGVAVITGNAPSADPTSSFSNQNPGTYGEDWRYATQATFDFLARRGIQLVKIPFRWERIQPKLNGRLNDAEVRRLQAVATRAGNAGLDVILDMHNFGAYYIERDGQGVRCSIGEAACPISAFAGAWKMIAKVFKSHPAVVGYTLMTEPVGLQPQGSMEPDDVWKKASQAAVDAIRSTRDTNLLMICGYPWAGVRRWQQHNPEPWITDPRNAFMYEGHHYWSQRPKYEQSYAEEVAIAQSRGW